MTEEEISEDDLEEYRQRQEAEAEMIQEQWEEVGEQFEQQEDEDMADKATSALENLAE